MGVKRYELSDAQWQRLHRCCRARRAIGVGLGSTTGCS